MSILAKPTDAPIARTEATRQVSVLYAAVLVIFVMAQLFTFEEFLELVLTFNLPITQGFAYTLALLIVVFELFAIPFLLRMKLSYAFRWLSMMCGWLAASVWTLVSVWIVTTQQIVSTVGFTGTVGYLTPGWWAVLVAISLCILAAWSSWGLWPGARKVSAKK